MGVALMTNLSPITDLSKAVLAIYITAKGTFYAVRYQQDRAWALPSILYMGVAQVTKCTLGYSWKKSYISC